MHIVDTHRYTQIDAIVDITADIEVEFADITLVATIEGVVVAIEAIGIFIKRAIFEDQVRVVEALVIEHIHLIIGQVVAALNHTLSELIQRQFALRSTVETICHRQNLVEVAALVIVERKVQEAGATQTVREHETSLIEADVSLIGRSPTRDIALSNDTQRCCDIATTEKADSSRVGGNCRDVSTQSLHRTTHTHVTGSTIQILSRHFCHFICLLCSHRHYCCQGDCCK